MAVSIEEVKRLKDLTGVGLTDAKKALEEANGDFDKALSEMRKKGLTKATGDTADLLVGYQVAVDQQKQWNAYGMGPRALGGGMATATSSTIDVGTLVVDMYEPSTKKLIWTGAATKTIEPGKSQEKNQEHLNKAMEKLLKDFPPKAK